MPPTQKNERGIDRKRGAVGENVRGVFGGWAEERGGRVGRRGAAGKCPTPE